MNSHQRRNLRRHQAAVAVSEAIHSGPVAKRAF